MNPVEYRHLMNRAGFGCTLSGLAAAANKSRQQVVDELFLAHDDSGYLAAVKNAEMEEMIRDKNAKEKGNAEKKELRRMIYEKGVDLNTMWLRKMVTDEAQLTEKMTFFWHCHFACRDDNPAFLQAMNNGMRENCLGKFKNILMDVAQAPAMLKYLNNQQNKQDAPNENFAREVMELFTLGRGNYTERDIKEAARAFTGWSFEHQTMSFVFRDRQHDFGEKEFMGKRGNFDGSDIIDMILYRQECAHFIAGKVYAFFVNDERDEQRINELAEKLYMSDYHMGDLMRYIFMADWFYDKKNIGARIKSPVELLVGTSRILDAEYRNEDAVVYVQKILSQVLFMPPNVAGWPGGKRWIDNSSLIFRMDLGRKILQSAEITDNLKPDDDHDPNMARRKELEKKGKLNALEAKVNWAQLLNYFDANADEELFNKTCAVMLCVGDVDYKTSGFTVKGEEKLQKLKSILAYVMGRPEYQLC
jgi:uncharacterized protein (DUF1800 family)